MIKHHVKHPPKGHFCNVGLRRFCPGYKNVSNSDIILKNASKKVFLVPEIYTFEKALEIVFFSIQMKFILNSVIFGV
jgi:hypothetical protein